MYYLKTASTVNNSPGFFFQLNESFSFLNWTYYVLHKFICFRRVLWLDFENDKVMFPGGIYLFKFNNGNTRRMCEICSKLAIKTPERWHRSCVFIINLEQISSVVLVFPSRFAVEAILVLLNAGKLRLASQKI